MLKYRLTQIVFLVLLVFIFIVDKNEGIPFYYYFIPFVFYISMIAYGSYFIDSGFFIQTVCCGNTSEKLIALTFDDGPDKVTTTEVLDVLQKHNAKATFFVIGKKIKGNEEVLKRIDSEGHLIGNHTYSHNFWLDFYSPLKIKEELESTEAEVQKVISRKMNYFRPPYGVTNPMISKAVNGTNYAVVGWNIRSMDTVVKDNSKLKFKVLNKLKPGSVVLFHDTRAQLAECLDELLVEIKKKGYRIVPLNELINKAPYA